MMLRPCVDNSVKQEWPSRFNAEQPFLYYFHFSVYLNNV
ncbi:hypothetical protein SAMN04488121_103236 [Chitinophaga filiformis]|uniref:Uncharacterized protein n=1 Tax=Chitinophaga filiformis TaxID=104663 RepID=A0A1G7QZR4_CHIFI|nr:hypothetical protein SAMN04488121_103236 [Chitinophaga filiformis]